jgi:serine protease Do
LKARDEKGAPTVTASNRLKKGKDVDAKELSFDNLGFTVRNLTEDEKDQYKVKNGLMISDVKNYSKAFNQRLFAGGVIVSADKKEMKSVSDLKSIFDNKKGDAIMLKVVDNQGNSRLIGLDIPK